MRTLVTVSVLTLAFAIVVTHGRTNVESNGATSLSKTVDAFNARASADPIGNKQPPLTEDEIVASIRGWIRDYRSPASYEVYLAFHNIAETRQLPKGATLRYITSWHGYRGYHFDVWWVDLTISIDDKPAYTYRIRDRKISSRPLTQEERRSLEQQLERAKPDPVSQRKLQPRE